MNSDRIDRMMGEAMGPQAPLTRAEERAALAGTITLIVVAAIAAAEILLSQPAAQRPPAAASPAPQQAQPTEGRNAVPATPAGVARAR